MIISPPGAKDTGLELKKPYKWDYEFVVHALACELCILKLCLKIYSLKAELQTIGYLFLK